MYIILELTRLFPLLQDQYDNLAAHTQKGIEFLDKYGNFVKERCAIELEYATKLRWALILFILCL